VSAVIEARGLVVNRGHRSVLQGVHLSLGPGEGLALVGPNAAGKSTLSGPVGFAAIGGGSFCRAPLLAGHGGPIAARCPRGRQDETPDRIAVEDRVSLGRYPHRGALAPLTVEDRAAVARALRQTEIDHLARRPLGTLSAGERQLAALARGLAQEPSVLLLDEPASHLDVRHQLHLFRVLDEVRQRGVAVLAVIHDLPRAAAWAPRLALLSEGRIAAEGSPAEVLESEAAEQAFGVAIRGVPVGAGTERLWRFEERA
jgi:iron complex transport system ATP-binding protein